MKRLANLLFMAFIIPATTVAQQHTTPTEEVKFRTAKVSGAGPYGNMYVGLGDRSTYDADVGAVLPQTSGIPNTLTNVKEYYVILNPLQFYYQAYKKGQLSLDKFIKKAEPYKWPLADTVLLSAAPVRCGVAVVSALDENGNLVHVLDANQNHDFSDDIIRPTQPRFNDTSSIPVSLDYLEKDRVVTEQLALGVRRSSRGDSLAVLFTIPEFRYSRFKFNGKSYFLCMNASSFFGSANISVIADRPYFERASNDVIVGIGEYVNLDGYLFTFSGYHNNGREIVLSGEYASAIVPEGVIDATEPNQIPQLPDRNHSASIVASQPGFKAPEIIGSDITTGEQVSLADLKGKWVYVDFWSTTCGPCIAEFPRLKEIYGRIDKENVAFVGVVVEYGNGTLKRVMDEHQLPWATVQVGEAATSTDGYEIHSFPTTFLIDPEGVIRHKNIRAPELESKLREVME